MNCARVLVSLFVARLVAVSSALPRRVVASCPELRSALEETETVAIDIVASFECNTTSWPSTVTIRRNLKIEGHLREGQIPRIRWEAASKSVVAADGGHVVFERLVLVQPVMGIGGIDIVFIAAEDATLIFRSMVVAVRSCPGPLGVSSFQNIRENKEPNRHADPIHQIDNTTIEALDVVMVREEAEWTMEHVVFMCNVAPNDPKVMELYNETVTAMHDGLHDGVRMEYDDDDSDGTRTARTMIYIIISVVVVLTMVLTSWYVAHWRQSEEWNWEKETDGKSDLEAQVYKGGDSEEGDRDNVALVNSDVALEAPLGHGEFGKVYKGIWQGSTVAVKVIKHNDRCLQTNVGGPLEAFFARHISHPNVVQTYQISKRRVASAESPRRFFGSPSTKRQTQSGSRSGSCSSEDMFGSFDNEDADAPGGATYETWLILEYCEKYAAWDGPCWEAEDPRQFHMAYVARTALEIASAMNYLHSVRIIHGDLKTGNVLLKGDSSDPRGFICKVGDFGVSRFLAEDSHIETFTCGTVTHMPPEMLKGGKLTSAADVYSFAILLWEVLSGRRPFEGKNQAEIMLAVVNHAFRPAFPPKVPDEFRALIESCWRQDFEARPIFPDIIDQLSVLVRSYEQEEGLIDRAPPHELHARSSFFSPQNLPAQSPTSNAKKNRILVPKKFNSWRVNPAVAEARGAAILDSNRSLHLSLDDGEQDTDEEAAIMSIQVTRSVDSGMTEKGRQAGGTTNNAVGKW